MSKVLMNMLLASIAVNAIGAITIVGLAQDLERYKSLAKRQKNWGDIMNKIVMSHYKNGGEFLVEPGLESDLEAYLIMARNGMG